ncbi:hypothetical protein MAHJHV54_47130 [Mycobacterium avium subsp. hominissuis]
MVQGVPAVLFATAGNSHPYPGVYTDPETIARKVFMTADTVHDVIIIGSGPAGYTAALYTARDPNQ